MGFFDSILFIVLSITILLFQSQLLHLPIVSANDTLFPGDELSHPSTLVSSNGIFTLGFFKIQDSSYTNLTYLGIWYTIDDTVWVANRDLPIRGGDAILTLDDSGTLTVMNRTSGATLFNVSDGKVGGLGNKNNTRAMLQDSGNFIVYDIVTNTTIWESFDHPTDTLIVGMKLGYNLTAKRNWELTSEANDVVPTSGAFTMRMKEYQKSPQLLIYRHGDLYWASGPWNKTTRTFQWLSKYDHVFELAYDPSGMYLFVQMIRLDPSTTSKMMQLSPTGRFPNGRYPYGTVPDFCYGYGSEENEGCVGKLPQCRVLASVNGDVYRWDYGSSNSINSKSKFDENSSLSIGDCMERCWNDCTCIATTTRYIENGTGCIYGTEWNHEDIYGQVYSLISDKSKSNVSPKKVEVDPLNYINRACPCTSFCDDKNAHNQREGK